MPELLEQVAPKGAEMLLECIKNRMYLNGINVAQDAQGEPARATALAAPKITPKDRFIKWKTWTAGEILRRDQVIGPLWSFAELYGNGKAERRIIWSTGFSLTSEIPKIDVPIGQPVILGKDSIAPSVYIRTCDNKMLKLGEIKIEGGAQAMPMEAAKKAGMANDSILRDHDLLLMGRILLSQPESKE